MHVLIGYGSITVGFAGAVLGAITNLYAIITKNSRAMRSGIDQRDRTGP